MDIQVCTFPHLNSFRVATVVVFAILSGIATAEPPHRAQKAGVHFLATSTVVRGTWGYNQDIFLVDLSPAKDREPRLARLIDEYSNLLPPLSAEILTSQNGTVLRVK